LLLLAHTTRNAGDAALLAIAAEHLSGASLTAVVNHPREPWQLPVVPSPAASPDLRPLLRAARNSDALIALPGNPFHSTGRWGKPFLLGVLQVLLTQSSHKPFYVLPQTLGSFLRRWEEPLLRAAYRQARILWLRDQTSYNLAARWGMPPGAVRLASDPAFLLSPADASQAQAVLARAGITPGERCLGVSLIGRITQQLPSDRLTHARAALIASIVSICQAHQLRLVLFAQSSGPTPAEDDRLPARAALLALPAGLKPVLIEETLSPNLLAACYGQMEVFATMRLHAGLFALRAGVPTLFVGYLPKTRAVLQTLGWHGWDVDLAEADGQHLTQRLDALWQEREALRTDLSARLPDWQADALHPFTDLRAELGL